MSNPKNRQGNWNSHGVYINGPMLKTILKLKKVTQIDLAAAVGIHRNTVINAIRHSKIDRLTKLFGICKHLDIHPFVLSENPIYNFSITKNGKNIKKSIRITPQNISKYIDELNYVNGSSEFYSVDDVESFFKYNDNSRFIDLQDKIQLYTSFVMSFRNKMIDMYLSLDEQDSKKYIKYLKEHLYKELDKNK